MKVAISILFTILIGVTTNYAIKADLPATPITIEMEETNFVENTPMKKEELLAPIQSMIPTTIEKETIEIPIIEDTWVEAPIPSSVKTYESYHLINDRTSKAWKLLQTLIVGDDGIIRDSEGYIAAALGSYFGPIGSCWEFKLIDDDGIEKILYIIKADQKQDRHTNEYNINGIANTDIIEFVVDPTKMVHSKNGYVYNGNFNNCPKFRGTVVAWREIK